MTYGSGADVAYRQLLARAGILQEDSTGLDGARLEQAAREAEIEREVTLESRFEDIEEQIAGTVGVAGNPGYTFLSAEFAAPAADEVSQTFYLPNAVTAITAPVLQAVTGPVAGSVTVLLEADQGIGFVTILGSDVALGAGEVWAEGATPTVQALDAGAKVRVKITAAPVDSADGMVCQFMVRMV